MKFNVKVEGEAAAGLAEKDFELDAANGTDAANSARDQLTKLVLADTGTREGGLLSVEVFATESWTQVAKTKEGIETRTTYPPGKVSEFSFFVEPHESVRKAVEERRAAEEAAAAEAAKVQGIRMQLLAELKAGGHVAADLEFPTGVSVSGKAVSE